MEYRLLRCVHCVGDFAVWCLLRSMSAVEFSMDVRNKHRSGNFWLTYMARRCGVTFGVYIGAMSMPHIHPSHIALTSSHIHHSDEPNAIIFIQVLALSHRAQALL